MTSRALSPLVREIYFQCMGIECGHRFVAHLGIVRTLVPSMHPRDDVMLPMVERRTNDIIVARTPNTSAPPPGITQPAARQPVPPAFN
ncbi:F420-dependent methylenetetrahydromethanopterin dehydrogenase [Dyella sp. SG562]|nr:F420-dependent methylenetetrahydromethanopterin dehydrogenase [Dyella sp. SG562]